MDRYVDPCLVRSETMVSTMVYPAGFPPKMLAVSDQRIEIQTNPFSSRFVLSAPHGSPFRKMNALKYALTLKETKALKCSHFLGIYTFNLPLVHPRRVTWVLLGAVAF